VDAATITAIAGALGLLGGGAWKLIDRADKKRERREVAVEELLKLQIVGLEADKLKLEAQNLQERQDSERREKRLKRYNSQIKSHAGKWREQLIANNIDPEPADWPEDKDD
jgi:FtsZ-binding cell division protein ZapB